MICVFLCAFVALFAPLANAGSTPAFWQVKSKTAVVYLLGSIHFGKESFYPLPDVVNQGFLASQELVVEVDVTKITPSDALVAIMRHGRLPQGQTLEASVAPATWALLQKQALKAGVPTVALQSFKPWFVALQLMEAEIRSAELQESYGVDKYFLNQSAGKTVTQLETLDGQLGIFGSLSMVEQEAFLLETLAELGESGRYLKAMANDWEHGNLVQLEATILAPFKANSDVKGLYKTLFVDRNAAMAQSVLEYLKGSKTVFFVVGAGHMIGDDGIIARLKKAGYSATLESPKPLPIKPLL